MKTRVVNDIPGGRPNRRKLVLPLAALIALLAGTPGNGQDKTSPVDKIFSSIAPNAPGCAVAVSHHGKLVVNRAYGLADLERDVPLKTDSVFDVGSVVKQFVAAATLLLVEEGKLSLTGDVRKYIPELPDYGHRITLDHLLTHTSGIRDWTGLGPLTGRQIDALTLTLRQRGLNFAPGAEWSYSNSGYVLLKEIVARTSGASFADFTQKRLFEPLGMTSTRYVGDMQDIVKNRAQAYDKAGSRWRLDMHFGNDRGGGGALFSTARDLLLWNDALTNARLGKFVTDKLQEPAALSNGRKLGYARGLMLETNLGGRMIWHTGGSAGYGSWLSRHPDQGLSMAVLCNAGETVSSGRYARQIFDLFVAATSNAAQPPAAPGPSIEGIDLKDRTGVFFNEQNGQPLRLVVEGQRFRVAGGPALVPVSKDRFRRVGAAVEFMSGDEFELSFVSPDAIELKSTDGRITRYRRAEPYAPTAEDLKAFAGRYGNDETGAVFQFAPGNAGLIVRLNDSQPFVFVPVDRDTFQLGGMILRFRREAGGKVVGLDYSNPIVRNISFTRRSDDKSGS